MVPINELKALADRAVTDDDASRLERDAGHFVRLRLKMGLSVPADVADVLTRYQGKPLQQNRWGK